MCIVSLVTSKESKNMTSKCDYFMFANSTFHFVFDSFDCLFAQHIPLSCSKLHPFTAFTVTLILYPMLSTIYGDITRWVMLMDLGFGTS